MLEFAQNLEYAARNLRPLYQVGGGIACVVIGLLVWLGGSRFRVLLVGVIGAVVGGLLGYFLTGRNSLAGGVSALVTAVIAVLFEKVFVVILAAGLAAVFCFAFFSFRQSWSEMPLYGWAIVGAPVVIILFTGVYLRRITSALCCALFGTALLFAGMILLLLYKGALPITDMSNRTLFYVALFVAMTAFGTFEQLMLCPAAKTVAKKKQQQEREEEASGRKKRSWRTG
jgi:signal transduction histidine kinase